MWNNTLLVLPVNGEVVWLRIEQFSFFPPIATFDSVMNRFIISGSGLIVDALNVARWKSKELPVALGIGNAVIGTSLIVV